MTTEPSRFQWAYWLSMCADEADSDDISDAERHGLRLAATHLLGERERGWAAAVELDDVDVDQFRANVWRAVENGHALHGPAASKETR